ncbi:uncharacterized protein LOC125955514 [Anopheles darlingi]|uniref:uncharacterized protein LOC125955514 n=1 Tax=Anopheles darlingi TaxID=43151 RepID=UPI0020FFFFF4|nr:uncharacterized protein LOC125955514 [Anopheles darlingi]
MATINKVRTSKLSYFFGEKAATDVLCFTKIIPRGSYLPQDITYYIQDITGGAIKSNMVNLRIDGRTPLRYNILVKYYCSL